MNASALVLSPSKNSGLLALISVIFLGRAVLVPPGGFGLGLGLGVGF